MKKRFLLLIMAMCFAIGLKAQETSLRDTVAFPNTNQSTALIQTGFNYAYSQSIYLSSELTPGILSGISWYLSENTAGTRTFEIEVLISETSTQAFESNTLLLTPNFTSVYTGSLTISGTGWHNVEFQVPYVYTGANNLVVAVRASMGQYFYSTAWGMGAEFSTPAIRTLYTARDSRAVTPEDPSGVYSTTLVPSAIFTRLPEGTDICLPPTDLDVSNIDQESALISWSNPNEEGTTFTISYRAQGGELQTAGTTSDTTFQLNNLVSSTVYEVSVVANCGEESVSYPQTTTFNTLCGTISTFPWSEDFATNFVQGTIGGTVPNHCWINVNGGSSTYRWGGVATRSSLMGYFTTDVNSLHNDWLMFPTMDFTGTEAVRFSIDKINNTDRVEFDIYYLDVTNGDMISEADTSNCVYLTTVISDENTPSGEMFEVLLSEIENTSRLVFVNKKPNPSFYIPEVVIEQIECPNVYGLSAIAANVDAIQVNLNTLNYEGSGWTIAYGTADSIQSFNPTTATTIIVNDPAEFPYLIQGLTPGTTYYITAKQNCGGEYCQAISITLPSANSIVSIPYTQNFDDSENISEFQFQNTTTNAWTYGTAVNSENNGGGAIYISNDNGATHSYAITENTTTANYFSTLVSFPTDASVAFRISFDWLCKGETTYDYFRVYLLPLNYELSNGSLPESSFAITEELSENIYWQNKEIILDAAGLLGTVKKLVFVWANDYSWGNNPPAAIDNLEIVSLSCIAPASVTCTRDEDEPSSAIVNITSSNPTETIYQIEYKPANSNEWQTETTTETTYTLINLQLGTQYDLRVAALCDGELTNYTTTTFVTPCAMVEELPYTNTFATDFVSTGIGVGAPMCWINLSTESYYRWSTYRQEREGSQDADNYVLAYNGDSYGDSRPVVGEWIFTPAFNFDGGQRLQFETQQDYSWERGATLDIFALDVTQNDITSLADTANAQYITSINISGGNWDEREVILSNVTTTSRLAFAVRHNASKFFIDNLRINQAPPCPDVHGLNVSTPDGSSILVTFDTLGAANGWIVAYGVASENFDPETATQITIPAGVEFPYTIATNVEGGNYMVAVKQNCEGAYWSDTRNLFIPIVQSVPYAENFDDSQTIGEWSVAAPNQSYATSPNKWCYGTAVNNTTDENGVVTNGGAFYVSQDNGVSNSHSEATTLTALSTYLAFGDDISWQLSFDWKGRGEYYYDYMQVYLLPLGEELPIDMYSAYEYQIGESRYNNSSEWGREDIVLDSRYANSIYQLVFMWYNDGATSLDPPAAVDNINIKVRSCFEVSDLQAFAEETADGVQATISFTDTINQGAEYKLEYRPNLEQEPWITIQNITNPYILTGLQYNTEYQVRVMTMCSATDSSQYVETIFTTPCSSLTAPLTDGFEALDLYGSHCWNFATGMLTETPTTPSSSYTTWGTTNRALQYNGTNKLNCNIYGNGSYKWLISPSINLGDTNTQLYELSVDIALTAYFSTNPPAQAIDDKFAIVISEDNGATWSSVNALIFADNDSDTEHNFSDLTNSFIRVTYPLQDATGTPLSGRIRVAFYGESLEQNGDNDLFVDNLEINFAGVSAPCYQPESLTIETDNISSNGVVLSWSAGGNESGWEVRVGENGTIENSTIPFYNITGLDDNTTYTVYVRSVCNATNRSEWDSIQFTTLQVIPCDAPTNLVASNITETSAEITWNGTATTYEFKLNGGEAETLTTTTKALTGLTANTAYTVEVRAICEDQQSAWVTTNFTTLEETVEPDPCDAPTNLSASNITETTANITWEGTATTYEFKLNGGEAETLTTTTKALTGLTPNTAYTVEVRSICEEQTSDWVTTNFTTLEEQVVIELGEVTTSPATEVGNTSATLNGALVSAGNAENFTVGFALATVADFTLEDTEVQNITATLAEGTFSQSVNDLAEGQTYFYRAYITNEAGTAYGTVETFTLSSLTDAIAGTITATIYPNPATDNATMEIIGLDQDAKIVISDLQGRILSQEAINAGETHYTINVSNMASGVYYIRIVTDKAVSTQKLIVE